MGMMYPFHQQLVVLNHDSSSVYIMRDYLYNKEFVQGNNLEALPCTVRVYMTGNHVGCRQCELSEGGHFTGMYQDD